MDRTLVVLIAGLALAACGGEEAKEDAAPPEAPTAPPAPAAPEAPPGPAPVEGYDWAMHGPVAEDPTAAYLSYAVPETDDVPLMFECRQGSGTVSASTDSGLTGVDAVILRSGEAQAMYLVARRVPSELSGGELLTIDIPTSDATLQAFRAAGWINMSVAGVARDLAAHPGSAGAAIERFFSFCAPAPAPSPETPGETATAPAAG